MPPSKRSGTLGEEQSTSLITRACDMCRQKKIRCDVVSQVCAQCIKYKTPCHFTPIRMTRAPRQSGRDRRVEELEKRLKSMEAQLQRALPNRQSGFSATGLGDSPPFSDLSEAGTSGTSSLGSDFEGEDLWDPASAIPQENFQSPDSGVPWPRAPLTAAPGSQRAISTRAPNSFSHGFKGRVIKALPPRDRVLSLVEKSFQGFHSAYPLFDQATFMSIFDSPDTSLNDPGQWACLNVVLALTPQFRHPTAQDVEEDRETWGYFQNAFAVTSQLMTRHVTLWSVQALLGMALVILGTPNQGPVSLLTSAAIKLAQRMGLHRQCQDPNLSSAEIEERKRVFWIAYSLDKDLSLQMGQPSAQDDDDMDVEFPSENDSSLMYPGESTGMDFFNCRTRLAIIQGQIYKCLRSVKATKQSVAERVVAARDLEAILQSWRASVPLEFMRDYHKPPIQMPTSGTSRHPIILQLSYFNSLAIIYDSLPALPRYRELRGAGEPIEFQLLSAPLVRVTEARKAIKLLQVTPQRRYACIWAVLHIFVAATTTLLGNIIRDPSNPMAPSDLSLIEPLLTLLGVLAQSRQSRKSERVNRMYQCCVGMFEKAKIAFESTNPAGAVWNQCITSGQSPGRENVEDFLRRMENISSGYDMELDTTSAGISVEFALAIEQQFQELPSM